MFKDSDGRLIEIVETENGCQALHDGKLVASAQLNCLIHPNAQVGMSKRLWRLTHLEVAADYRNAGIATEMFYRLKSWFQPLEIPDLPDKLEDATDWPQSVLGWFYRLNRKGLILKKWPTEHDTVRRLRRHRSIFEP